MAATISTALRLAARLDAIDRDVMCDLGRYSHASAHTDRVRAACRTDSRIPADVAERVERRAVQAEGDALATMIETVEDDGIDARRRAAVAALEAAGLTSGVHGGWGVMRAGRHIVQMCRDLDVCRLAIVRGTNPKYGRTRGAELIACLTACGVACDGYLPA